MKKLFFFLCALMLIFGIAGIAGATLINNDFGLNSPANTITFDGFADGTTITDQYTGVNFSPSFLQSYLDFSLPHISGGSLQNYSLGLSPPSFSIFFTNDQTSAAFTMNSFPQNASFTANLNGVFQESFDVYISSTTMPDNFYGFKGIVFDEIFVAVTGGVILDNLQFNPVPEPATMLLLGTGLVGLAGFGRKKILKRK